jgi:hypothetical protein
MKIEDGVPLPTGQVRKTKYPFDIPSGGCRLGKVFLSMAGRSETKPTRRLELQVSGALIPTGATGALCQQEKTMV